MKKLWTLQEEAQNLERLFSSVANKAAFAREFNVPGGGSMISQHISGNRPIGIDGALAYARGFGVSLAEISPRLAAQTAEATKAMHGMTNQTPDEQPEGEGDVELSTSEEWRLFRAFQMLPIEEQQKALDEIETRVSHVLGRQLLEQKLGAKSYATDEKVSRTIKPAPRGNGGT